MDPSLHFLITDLAFKFIAVKYQKRLTLTSEDPLRGALKTQHTHTHTQHTHTHTHTHSVTRGDFRFPLKGVMKRYAGSHRSDLCDMHD